MVIIYGVRAPTGNGFPAANENIILLLCVRNPSGQITSRTRPRRDFLFSANYYALYPEYPVDMTSIGQRNDEHR